MFRDALIIFNKEMKNLTKDKRTLLMLVLFPLIIMPAVFGTIGIVAERQEQNAVETTYILEIENNFDSQFQTILSKYLNYKIASARTSETIVIQFPEEYSPGEATSVTIYYDSRSSKSVYASQRIQNALREYEDFLADQILQQYGVALDDIRTIKVSRIDTAPQEAQGAGFLARFLPYIILIYIFSGSMNIGLDTTAGEKERGSLASILVNQVSRTSIAIGKIMYVIASGLLNSLSSFIGILIAFKLIGSLGGESVIINLEIFSIENIVGLLLTLVSISGVAASLIIFLGSLAKNMKEGGSYILPMYILIVIVGVATMQMDSVRNIQLFFIPFVNGVFMIKEILVSEFHLLHLSITVMVNVALAGLMAILIARLFNSERILKTV